MFVFLSLFVFLFVFDFVSCFAALLILSVRMCVFRLLSTLVCLSDILFL